MSAARRTKELSSFIARWAAALARFHAAASGRTRVWLAAAFAGAVVLAGAYLAWRWIAPTVAADPQYQLTAERIFLPPRPAWISPTTDIRGEVLRHASLDGSVSLLDEALAERMAKAFAMHPWVKHVERVTKRYPARVDVMLTYRRPAAIVEVSGALFPVDVDGELLPSDDFSSADVLRYPRISGIETAPAGSLGDAWGDPRVTGAAQVADAVGGLWMKLGLERIVPSPAPVAAGGGIDYTFELYTARGTRVLWGFSPRSNIVGEPPSDEKIARLERYVVENGSLDAGSPSEPLDVRSAEMLSARPRQAPR